MKKIISLILLCTIIISSFSLAGAEYSDITLPDAPYVDEINLVVGLGLMTPISDESFGPEEYVTRGEFLNIVAPLMGIDSMYTSVRQVFSDVDTESPWAHSVAAAYDLGIVSGSSSNFYPDRNISCNEALKIMIHILGYDMHANEGGGYPSGYVRYANDLDITDRLVSGGDEYLSRGEVALIISNSLGAKIYSPVDEPLLMERLGLKRATGRMTSNSRTSLTGDADAAWGRIAIEFTSYKTAQGFDSLLGYEVVCYYTEVGKDRVAKYIAKTPANELITITKQSLGAVDGRNISYEEDGKVKKLTVPNDVYMIYNHFSYVNYPADVYDIERGSIKLLDNNGDGTADIAFVNEYENKLLKGVDTNVGKIYAEGEIIEFDDKLGDTIIDTDTGAELALADLKSGVLVSIFKNPENSRYVIYVNNSVAEGVLQEVGDLGITIDQKDYECTITDSLKDKIGSKIRLFLDCEGYAVMIDESQRSDAVYGYILNARITSGIGKRVELMLMSEDNSVKTLTAAKELSLDGIKIKGEELLDKLTSASYAITDPNPIDPSLWSGYSESKQAYLTYPKSGYYTDDYSRLIRYKLNGDGEIREIDTSHHESSYENDAALTLSGRYPNGTYDSNMNYRTETRIFMGAFGVETDAKIFLIPETLSARENYSEDLTYDFGVDSISYLKEDTNYPTGDISMIEAYNFDDCNVSDVLVLYIKVPDDASIAPSDDLGKGYPVLIIEEISNVILPSGDTGKKLTGTGRSGQVTLNISETFYEQRKDKLVPGSIIGYKSVGGQLTGVQELLTLSDAQSKNYQIPEKAWAYRDNPPDAFSFGQVESADESFVLLYGPRRNVGTYDYVLYGLRDIYIYDTERGKVRKGSAGDIRSKKDFGAEASDLFVFTSYGSTRLIVIYE